MHFAMDNSTIFPSMVIKKPAIPAVLGKSGCKGIGLKAFRKPLKAMDGFRERQDGFMRVCEKLLGQSPCWHSLFSAGMADCDVMTFISPQKKQLNRSESD
jgi:hypothetical protein